MNSDSVPILQQEKSSITTNPFIPNTQKEKEMQVIDSQANAILQEYYNSNKNNSIQNLTLSQVTTNVSTSFTGFLDDLFIKDDNTSWKEHLIEISTKDQRYAYLGVLLICVSLFLLLVKRTN